MQVADLIILTNVNKRYTYIIPIELNVNVGDFVDIIFSKRAQIGLITNIKNAKKTDYPYPLSHIQSIHEKRAPVPFSLLKLIEWFACHYCITDMY